MNGGDCSVAGNSVSGDGDIVGYRYDGGGACDGEEEVTDEHTEVVNEFEFECS